MMPSSLSFHSKRYAFTYGLYAVICGITFIFPPAFLQQQAWILIVFGMYFLAMSLLRLVRPLVKLSTTDMTVQIHPIISGQTIAYASIRKLEQRKKVLIVEFEMPPMTERRKFIVVPLHPLSTEQQQQLLEYLKSQCPADCEMV